MKTRTKIFRDKLIATIAITVMSVYLILIGKYYQGMIFGGVFVLIIWGL